MTKEKANIGEEEPVTLNGESKLEYLESIKEKKNDLRKIC